jgi:hypothetical protein
MTVQRILSGAPSAVDRRNMALSATEARLAPARTSERELGERTRPRAFFVSVAVVGASMNEAFRKNE